MEYGRPTFGFPGAVISKLGAIIRKLKVGLFISRDPHGEERHHPERVGRCLASRANRKNERARMFHAWNWALSTY